MIATVSLDHYFFVPVLATGPSAFAFTLAASSLRFGDSDQATLASRIAAGWFGSASDALLAMLRGC